MLKAAAQALAGFLVFLILLLSCCGFLAYFEKLQPEVVRNERVTLDYWEEIIRQYPTYSPAYLELAEEQIRLGEGEMVQDLEARVKILGIRTRK